MLKMNVEVRNIALSIFSVYAITSIHHVYGAWLYETPWRTHIATQGFSWLIVSYLILWAYTRWKKKVLLWLFVLFAGFFFIGAIGFFEGGYNHVLKNILYFSGVEEAFLTSMYPPPKYELPNDWLFEISGILTFAVCMSSLRTMITLVKTNK